MSAKSVFISYRADSLGKSFAGRLRDRLEAKGYDVFLDVNGLIAGPYAPQLLQQIRQRGHFILAVTPNALSGCSNKKNWVRREYEEAKQTNRNIVPVFEESVHITVTKDSCPRPVRDLFSLQIARVSHATYDADIEKLISSYLSPSVAAGALPVLTAAVAAGQTESKIDWMHVLGVIRPFAKILLTLFVIAAFAMTLYHGSLGHGWNPYLIPVALGTQLALTFLDLPLELAMYGYAGVFFAVIGSVAILAALTKSQRDSEDMSVALLLLGTGAGSVGTGLLVALRASRRYYTSYER
jgi:hypothetical protein